VVFIKAMFPPTCVVILATPTKANYVLITKLIPLLCKTIKGKGRVHPRTGHEGLEVEERYGSTLSLTSALGGGGWSTPRPGRFTPGKDNVPIV